MFENGDRHMAWAIVYHMIGLDLIAVDELNEVTSPSLSSFKGALGEYLELGIWDTERRHELLQTFVREIGNLLESDPDHNPGLGYECARWTANSPEQELKRPTAVLSRAPFRNLTDQDVDTAALLAACYLLRGYALFFCRPEHGRDFNAAKVSLNDLHQAYQLAWQLYHNLPTCHHRYGYQSFSKYLRSVVRKAGKTNRPGKSEYFVWSHFLLCEVMRGNIYRQIGYLQEADRYYRHSQSRVDEIQLCYPRSWSSSRTNSANDFFITPTFIRGMFERSKVQFDLGQFLEALLSLVRCVRYLLLQVGQMQTDAYTSLISDLQTAEDFLHAERVLPIFDRERVCYLFGDTCSSPDTWPYISRPRSLASERLLACVKPNQAFLVASIIARMGFVLYTIRPRMLPRGPWDQERAQAHASECNDRKIWLKDFFDFAARWNSDSARATIPIPSDSLYGLSLLGIAPEEVGLTPEQIDRRLALLLRQAVPAFGCMDKQISESEFYAELLSTTTQNIGNLVTIPRRNRNIMMRHGYGHRRTLGDLSKQTVCQGIEAAIASNSDVGKAGLPKTGKLVVLRRYQSYSPILPRPTKADVRGGGYFLLWRGKGIVIDPGYDFIRNFYDEGFSLDDVSAVVITHAHPDHDGDFASLTSLVAEWNEFQRKVGQHQRAKLLDVFLNESAHWKFAA